MTTTTKIRATIAGYVAGLLNLDERAGAEVVDTKRNGSGTRVTIEFTWEAADRVLDEFAKLVEDSKEDKKSYSRDQLRAIERAGQTIADAQRGAGGVEAVGPDGGEYIARPLPGFAADATEAETAEGAAIAESNRANLAAAIDEIEPVGTEIGAGRDIASDEEKERAEDEAVKAVVHEDLNNIVSAALSEFYGDRWNTIGNARRERIIEAVREIMRERDMTARRAVQTFDAGDGLDEIANIEERRPAVVESSLNWWDAANVPQATRHAIASAKLSADASALRAAEAEKVTPAPKNLAALRAVATRAKRNYEALTARPTSSEPSAVAV